MDSRKGIIQFPGYPRIGISIIQNPEYYVFSVWFGRYGDGKPPIHFFIGLLLVVHAWYFPTKFPENMFTHSLLDDNRF